MISNQINFKMILKFIKYKTHSLELVIVGHQYIGRETGDQAQANDPENLPSFAGTRAQVEPPWEACLLAKFEETFW